MHPDAHRGLEVAAAALARAFDCVAVVDGDGARRLADALDAHGPARAEVLAARGLDAAWAAFGRAAAGEHVALVASGRDAVSALVPLLREAARLGVGLTLALPAHGDEAGRAVPAGPCDDLALVCDQPVGVLVAGRVAEVTDLALAALAFARATARPWCVAFELARVGCAAAAVPLPAPSDCDRWRAAPRGASLDDAWAFARAIAPGLGPVAGAGGDVFAGVPFAARGVGLRQLRPLPAAALAAATSGPLRVREPWPDAFGPGRLTAAVRLALGPGVAVAEGAGPDDDEGAARVDVSVDEPRRDALVREAVAALARCGLDAEAACHEPWAAAVRVRTGDPQPLRAVLCEPCALGLRAVVEAAATGAPVVAVGAGDLAALRGACEATGRPLRHDADASLAPCPKA
ncbi:MAG: hypothetical protein U0324_31665 [Polyangiales bacterium]